jgi:hypothetical protein
MIDTSVIDARTIILILPIIILRDNILRHYYLIDIRLLIWSVDYKQSPLLVIISVETIYIEIFLDYTRGLVSRQKLDRIIINKDYLTIITSDYRPYII